MNSKTTNGSIILLAAVLVAGTVSMTIPSSFALPYVPDFTDPYVKDHKKKAPDVNIQKIKCVNSNFNANGIDINLLPQGDPIAGGAQADEVGAAQNGEGNGLLDGGINIDRNLVNICGNLNLNGQLSLDELF